MAYARRDIRGGAVQTTITGGISSGATSCSIAATTGWPDGSAGGFYVVIDPGTASEEKILCSTRSSTTVNFTTRGADGSTAASHTSGAVIYPVMVAVDADEANYWVAELAGAINTAGDIPVADGADSLTTLAKGSASTVLQVSSGNVLQYGTVTSAMITDGTIVNDDISASAGIAQSKMASQSDATILGNNAGSSGPPLALTIAQVKAMLTNMPWGVVGYTEITSAVSLGSTGNPEDVAGLTVTVTLVASRKYRVSCYTPAVTNGDARIRESTTTLQRGYANSANSGFMGLVEVILNNPSAGSHTYKASSARSSSGSWGAESIAPSFIMVEDIGAST